jgi:hypothetical protein
VDDDESEYTPVLEACPNEPKKKLLSSTLADPALFLFAYQESADLFQDVLNRSRSSSR